MSNPTNSSQVDRLTALLLNWTLVSMNEKEAQEFARAFAHRTLDAFESELRKWQIERERKRSISSNNQPARDGKLSATGEDHE